jgi:hypothetical protein
MTRRATVGVFGTASTRGVYIIYRPEYIILDDMRIVNIIKTHLMEGLNQRCRSRASFSLSKLMHQLAKVTHGALFCTHWYLTRCYNGM